MSTGRFSLHDRAAIIRAELAERIMRLTPEDGRAYPLDGLMVRRVSAPTEMGHGTSYPALCVVAQGSKDIRLGEHTYRYDPAHYLVVSAALPIATRIVEASPEHPYLGVVLTLEPAVVSAVMADAGSTMPRSQASVMAIEVNPLPVDLLDAVVRLVRLADSPADARMLADATVREIVYRLLAGDQAARLRQIAAMSGETNRIGEAIARLRSTFDRPLQIEVLARDLGMSVSSFHHHFKAVTAMSPLQFQKQLRLQEARRLMLGGGHDATSAGLRVGYGDTSQFSREYKRLFGAPPMRDVARLRGVEQPSPAL